MNISKPATMPDGRILVTCFGDPLPPPARGTHALHVGCACPCPRSSDPAVISRHNCEAVLAARWSAGRA